MTFKLQQRRYKMKTLLVLLLPLMAYAGPSPSPLAVCPHPSPLQVGADKPYKKIMSAVQAACDGDTIEVDAGDYVNDNICVHHSNLTIKGVNGRPHIIAVPLPGNKLPPTFPLTFEGHIYGGGCQDKGIIVQRPGADNFTVINMEISGAKSSGFNGAAIRGEGTGLTVKQVYFHHNEDGILMGKNPVGWAQIEDSEFAYNGAGDGQSHGIYIGEVSKLTVLRSSFHNTKVGHNLKSRARHVSIQNSKFYDGINGTASYQIDLSGGQIELLNNYIQKGLKASNISQAVYFYTDKNPITPEGNKHSLMMKSNVFVCFLPKKNSFVHQTNFGIAEPMTTVSTTSMYNVFVAIPSKSGYTYGAHPIKADSPLVESNDKTVYQGDAGWENYLQPMPE